MRIDILKDDRNVTEQTAGTVIFAAGEPGELMYCVVEGEVDVVLDGEVLETVGEGGIIGEMALVDHQ